jgi:lysophospholipase L1-like esterase
MKLPHQLLPFILSLLIASSLVAAETVSNPAAEPTPRDDWRVRHAGFVQLARQGGIELLFVGDSITDGWRSTGKEVWAKNYAPLKAANFGIGGDRTENVLWRLQNGNLDGISPKVVVLMIGTNNLGPNTVPQIAEGVAAIVQEIRTRTPASKILLLAVFPRAELPNDPLRLKAAELNAVIAKLGDEEHVFFLDIGAKFLQPDGKMAASVMPDFLHPTAAGDQIWADAIAPKLAELMM